MDEDRSRGMGIVVEYAGRKGKPQWHPPGKSDWNYLLFGESKSAIAPDEVIPMEIGKSTEAKADSTSGRLTDNLNEQSEPIKIQQGHRLSTRLRQ